MEAHAGASQVTATAIIALTHRENCELCETRSGVTNPRECYGCAVRFVSRLMRPGRINFYARLAHLQGEELCKQFRADVKAYYAARKAQP
jgi:hypothetical protein